MRSLCERCTYRQQVILHELGPILDRCTRFKIELRQWPSAVTSCSSFSAADENPIFAGEAWLLFVDGGKVSVLKPKTREEEPEYGYEKVERS